MTAREVFHKHGFVVTVAVLLVLVVAVTIWVIVSDPDFGRPSCGCPRVPETRWHYVTSYDAKGQPCGGNLQPYVQYVAQHTSACQAEWDAYKAGRVK